MKFSDGKLWGPRQSLKVLSEQSIPLCSSLDRCNRTFKKLQTRLGTKILLMTAFEVTSDMISDIAVIKHADMLKKQFRLAAICQLVKGYLHVTYWHLTNMLNSNIIVCHMITIAFGSART